MGMKLVDAHIHLSDPEYNQKMDELLEDAKRSNVVALVSNSMNLQTSLRTLQLTKEHPNLVYAALGIHPWNIRHLSPNEVQETVDLILQHETGSERVVAVGEIGLDYQYSGEKLWESQLKVFHEMLSAAEKKPLPVIIHSRGTTPQIINLLPSYSLKKVLLHWFSRPTTLLPQIVDKGYYISEGPPSVYSNHTRDIIKRIPLTNLLTETDGPVSFRGPFKGKMTTPAFLPLVVKAIAEIKEAKEIEVADQILQNFTNLFGIAFPKAKAIEGAEKAQY